jgi:hypothetical protein
MLVCLTRAQLERAIDELRSATQEEAVEARCLSDYTTSVKRLAGCPSCLDVHAVGNEVLSFMNQHSNLAFCAQ